MCEYRKVFDGLSSEFKNSSLEEKKELLRSLINKNIPLKIAAIKMMDYCNKNENKDIKEIDIIFALADLLEEVLKETNDT
jgi:hypothetical protein